MLVRARLAGELTAGLNLNSAKRRLGKCLFVAVPMPQSALLAITLLVGVAAGMLLALNPSGKWNKQGK